jgi:uncharacterized protein YegL
MIVGNKWLLAISLLAVAAIGVSYLLYRRKVALSSILRFLAAASIVASFGGIQLEVVRNVPLAVYVLDVSESYAPGRLGAVEAIRTHASGMSLSARAALVSFGTAAALDGPVDVDDFSVGLSCAAGLGGTATSIEAGLRAAAALKGSADRVYLFSDGRANTGNTEEGALLCSQEGIRVLPVILDTPAPADAWISHLEAPGSVHPGRPVKIFVHAGSNRTGILNVSLTVGTRRLVREIATPGGGATQRAEFQLSFGEPGREVKASAAIVPLLSQVSAAGFSDSFPANNVARGAVRILGPPKLLVCTNRPDSAVYGLLRKLERFSAEEVSPEKLPETPGRLRDAAVVVLDNVPAHSLSAGQMAALKRYVRDLGGGLIVLGGPGSYGPGGYIETALEEALPLWCNPENRKKASLVFVLDASGSMGQEINFMGEGRITKFRAALRAILPVYREIREGDEVAVVTFNTRPTVELPLTIDNDGSALRAVLTGDIVKKKPGEKTNIYPALRQALKLLEAKSPREREERILHVILLSDGAQTIEDGMDMKKFRDAGVSVSTVATGAQPDRERLKEIAQRTGGRYYEVAEFDSKLRDVFPKEIRQIAELTRTGRIKVEKTGQAEFLKGIESFPELAGIVLTTAKDESHVLARTGRKEPVLAWWRLGLGRVVAFTGALDDDWGKAWLRWEDLQKLLLQAVDWLETDRHNPDFTLTAHAEGMTVRASLVARSGGRLTGSLKLKAVFSCGDEHRVEFQLRQVGPGEYEAAAQALPEGFCVVTVFRETGEVLNSTEVWVAGTLESGPRGPDVEALSRLAALTGGEVLGEEAFLADTPQGRGGRGYDLWWVLLVLAGCFFLADIAQGSVFAARKLKAG